MGVPLLSHKTQELFAEFSTKGLVNGSQHTSLVVDAGCHLSDGAKHLLWYKLRFSSHYKYHRLVAVTPRQYGIVDVLDLPTFYYRAIQSGLRRCRPEVAPKLRSLYKEQPVGDVQYVAIKAISDAGGGRQVLALSSRRNGLWLTDFRWHYDIAHLLSCDTPWLFEER